MPERAQRRAGWTVVAFGDVVRQVKDRVDPDESGLERYIAGEHMDTDDLRLRRWGDIGDGYLGPAFHMRFKPGHVLYGSRRTYLRKVAVADFEGITANTTFVLEPKDPKMLLPGLLPYIMQTEAFNQHSVRESKGSVNPYVNFSDLAWYEFALPPIEEQSRAVEVLHAVAECDETLLIAKQTGDAARDSLASEMFAADMNEASVPLRAAVTESRYGPRFSSSLYSSDGRLAQLRTTDISEEGEIAYDTIPHANLDPAEYRHHLLEDRDVVISRSGSCGITAVYRARDIPTIPAAFLVRLRTTDKIIPEYLHEFFSSPIGRRLTASLARGGVQKNINASQLMAQLVPCPEVSRQIQVVSTVDALRSAARAILRRRHDCSTITTAVLGSVAGLPR